MAVKVTVYGTANMRQIEGARKELDRLEKQALIASRGFGASMTRISNSMKAAGAKVTRTGRSMTTALTLPIIGMGIGAAIAFDQVDSGLDTVAARSGKTGAQLANLGDVFEAVALKSQQGFDVVGEVVGRVGGKFGLMGKDAEKLSTQILDLAYVTGVDAVTATDAIGQSLTAFGIPAQKAGGFLDALLAASQKANIGVDVLASTAAKAAPTFKTYGLNAKESVALIASMQGAGIPSTRVIAGLNSAFKKFADEGVKDIPGALTKVLTGIRDMKDPTKATALAVDLFGSRVGVTLAEAVRSGKVSVDDLAASLDGSKGALERAKDAVDGPQEQFARLMKQVMLAASALITALLPAIESIIPYITQAVQWFQGLDDGQRKVIVVVGLLVAAIGPLLIILGSAITAIGAIVGAIAAVGWPVLAAVAVIGLLVGAVVLLWNKSEAFRDAVIKVWEMLKAAIASAVQGIRDKLEENREKLDKLKEAFSKVWEFVQAYVFPVIANLVGNYLSKLITTLGWVIGKVIDVIGWIVDFGETLYEAGKKVAIFYLAAKEKVEGFFTAVATAGGNAIGFLQGLPGKVKSVFLTAGQWLLDAGKAIVDGLWNGIKAAWGSMTAWLNEQVDKLPDAVKTILGINSPARRFIPVGEAIPEGIAVGVTRLWGKATSAVTRLGRDVAAKARKSAEQVMAALTERLDAKRGALSRLQEFFTRARDIIVDAFAQMKSRAQARIDEITGTLQGLTDDALAYAGAIRSSLAIAFQVPGVDEAQARVVDAQNAMTDAVAEFGRESEEAKRAVKALADAQKDLAKVKAGGGVLGAFRKDIADGTEFVAQIRQLRDFGLNEASLQNIIQKGVDQGRQIAASLLSGGPSAIGEVNALTAAFDEQVAAMGDLLSADKFGAQIAQAKTALVTAQEEFAAIAVREAAQLAQLDALAQRFGIQTDAMTAILNGGADRIAALMGNEDAATTLLGDAVAEVTAGLIETAAKMAEQAAALQRDITALEARVAVAQISLAAAAIVAPRPSTGSGSGGGSGSSSSSSTGSSWAALLAELNSNAPSEPGAQRPEYGSQVPHGAVRSLSGGSTITVAEGAVQVVVGSESQKADTQAAVDAAFKQLIRELGSS